MCKTYVEYSLASSVQVYSSSPLNEKSSFTNSNLFLDTYGCRGEGEYIVRKIDI